MPACIAGVTRIACGTLRNCSVKIGVVDESEHPDFYAGMTLNERLFESGMTNRFAQAAKEKDAEEMIRILTRLSLDEKDARWSTETILKNPRKYGY
jgi:hypothetical protein